MNLQQLNYIIAVKKHQHFAKASEACGVSQPTLSAMIQKLEAELEVTIFDRSKQPVEPTAIGNKIITQAEKTLREAGKVTEIVEYETKALQGELRIGIIPTLAPYLVPGIIKDFRESYQKIDLSISELTTASCISALRTGEIEMFIAATPLLQDDFFEIPLYYEEFIAYFSNEHPLQNIELSASTMPKENLWVLEEGHCLRDQLFNFCSLSASFNQVFEAGSIDTLIRIVDENGGYTVIPELHLPFLTDFQKQNIKKIVNPPAIREVSVVIHKDFIKERMINAVADSIKKIIPEHMLNERLKKFAIKL